MTRDEVLEQEVTKIIQGMEDNIESTVAQILNLHGVGMSKGETLTRLWWQANVDDRRLFFTLIKTLTTKGRVFLVDIEEDLPDEL